MIFIGDVAIAPREKFTHLGFPSNFLRSPLCPNLEGAVSTEDVELDWGVCNSPDWLKSFSDFVLGPVFLSNNHIHDLPSGVEKTLKQLGAHGFTVFGAGKNEVSASDSVIFSAGETAYALLGFGWPVIGCNSAGRYSSGINRMEGCRVRQLTRLALETHPSKRIVVVMHWNYEFERYPQPGHRKLAMELIDAGVHAVIGHHPHIVGPVERYRGRTIAYSLGNWAFSYGRFFGGKLRFPESSFHQIAVELGETKDAVHHARFSPPSTVIYEFSEDVASQKFSLKPEFEGYSHPEYIRWFRKHRVKRKGLPIYKESDASIGNLLRDRWVALRQVLVDAAAKTGIKPMRRSA